MKCRKIIILICLNPPLTPTIPRRMAEQISQLPKGVSPNSARRWQGTDDSAGERLALLKHLYSA